MEDYNKIIESLGVRFIKSKNIRVLQPLTVENFYDVGNTIILLHKGVISFGEEKQEVEEGDMLFIPGGRLVSITYGKFNPVKLTNEDLLNNRDKFFSSNTDVNLIGTEADSFSYITFEAKVFDSVNFFASLDIPSFIISRNSKLAETIMETIKEDLAESPGKDRVIKLNTERVVIEI